MNHVELNQEFGSAVFTGGTTVVHSVPGESGIVALVTTGNKSLVSEDIAFTLARVDRNNDSIVLTPAVTLSFDEMSFALRLLMHSKVRILAERQDQRERDALAARDAQRDADNAAFQAILARNGFGRA